MYSNRGKSHVGAFHSSDIPEYYGSSASPDFIGTDALGMLPNISYYQCGLTYRGCYYYSLQSTLPILVTLQFRTTQRVSSLMWTGSHGICQLSIRLWPSWTLLQTLALHSTPTEQMRSIYWTISHWDLLQLVLHSGITQFSCQCWGLHKRSYVT